MQIVRGACRLLAVCLLVLLVAPLAWTVVSGDAYLTVEGRSMSPTYELGDVLVVQRPAGRELDQVGTVVVMTVGADRTGDGGRYVHRVVEPLGDGRAWLQGDGNVDRDPRPVARDAVLGTPRVVITGGAAEVFAFSQAIHGRIALGALALLLLLVPGRVRATRGTAVSGRHRAGPAPVAAA